MKDLINYLVKSIVDQPEEVKITEEETEFGYTNIIVSVAQEDMGKVIGKSGKIIKSLRLLIKVASLKENKKVNLLLAESKVNQPVEA